MTAGSRFYLLQTLMSMSVTDDDDLSSQIIEIALIGTGLWKLCKNGVISVEDIQTASLIASIPDLFTSVTSPFEQHEDVRFDDVSNAFKGHVVARRNQAHQASAATSSTANAATNNMSEG